jgi:hypothetical protein
MRVRTSLAAALFASFFVVPAVAGDEPEHPAMTAEDLPAAREDWYGVYLKGTRVGWLRMGLSRTADAVVGDNTGFIDLQALGRPMTLELAEREEFDAAPPFALRSAWSEQKQNGVAQVVELTRGKDGWSAVVTEGGATRTPPVPALDYTLADALGPELWFRTARAVGDKTRFRSFDVSDLETDVDEVTVKARKESIVDGVPTVFFEASQRSERKGDTMLARVDAAGRLLSMFVGQLFEARREPEAEAKKTGKGVDLFVLGSARIDKPIGHATKVERLVVEVDGAGAAALCDAPGQSVVRDGKSCTLSLGADCGKDAPVDPKDVAAALAETVDLPTKAPQVAALAAQAVGDAKTQREKVDRLVRFVAAYVEDAHCAGQMSVLEIVAKKRGDCNAHAVLFAALARAAGVPARKVGGLMYMGDDVRAFGGHAWNEVLLDGKWVPVDPTWNETTLDGAHVTLSREGVAMDESSATGALTFRLKDVKHAAPATGR